MKTLIAPTCRKKKKQWEYLFAIAWLNTTFEGGTVYAKEFGVPKIVKE